ncbi:retinochrome-like [Littorina saxatilis]|uniref:retinochrome-like n=1 Tax=Littorina saxatilis TaxID=31220 RepID=UPI0038B454C8
MGVAEEAPQTVLGHGATAEFFRFEHVTVGSLYMLFCIGGVVSNLLLIVTLLKDKKLLRGTTSWLHVGLAVANIGVVAPSPFPASSHFSGKWLYGDKMCQAYAFEGMFVGLVAIGFVISLCIERYIVSARKEAMQENPSAFYWVATVLIVGNATFWAVMPVLGWSRYSIDHTGATCAIDWENPDEGYMSYMTVLSVFSFGLPMLTAILCLYKSVPDPAPVGSAASGSGQQQGTSGGQDEGTSSFTESQLRWLCLTFVALVLAGWGPFALLCIWAMVGNTGGVSMLAACIPPLSCKFVTMLYPLAYNVANNRCRAGYFSVIGAGAEGTSEKAE